MVNLTIEQALLRARSYVQKGEIGPARTLYLRILELSPGNTDASDALQQLAGLAGHAGSSTDPPAEQLSTLIKLCNHGQFAEAATRSELLARDFPNSFPLLNILGASSAQLGQMEQAVRAFSRATEVSPRQPDAHNNLGNVLRAQGRFDAAIAAYERAISIEPLHVVAQNNLGIALRERGRFVEAVAAHQRAIAGKSDYAAAHYNLGVTLRRQGKLAEAITAYAQAISINPQSAEAHYNLGGALRDTGRLDEALTSYRRAIAIRPGFAEAYNNMGAVLQSLGHLDEAMVAYDCAITAHPNHARAHINRGNLLQGQGELHAALAAYQQALAIAPDDPDAHNNMGNALHRQGQFDRALVAYERALTTGGSLPEAHYNRGEALQKLRRFDQAIAAYASALAIKPDMTEARFSMANALQKQGRLDEAISAYEDVLTGNPNHADAHNNLGVALSDLGRTADAIAAYQKAIAIEPAHADARSNQALALLAIGNLREGWHAHEWRWKLSSAKPARTFAKPLWLGDQPLAGKTILLWGEQGLGDQIQFARYASRASAQGARVILQVDQSLVRAMATIDGVNKVVALDSPVAETDFDLHCPLMSLPLAFKTELPTIPVPPRLTLLRSDVARWADALGTGRPRIAIAWSGNARHQKDRDRSIPLSQFAALLDAPVAWISPQQEIREADRTVLQSLAAIRHVGNQIKDFADTAALCEACDLVITVDTSLAHLAGTIGRPVWILLPFNADWRWLRNRDDSPWYPTARLYRQEQRWDWHSVLARVQRDLHEFLSGRY